MAVRFLDRFSLPQRWQLWRTCHRQGDSAQVAPAGEQQGVAEVAAEVAG